MLLRGYIDEGIKKETVYLKGIKRNIILKIEAYGKNYLFVYLVDSKGKLRGQYSYFNEKSGKKIFLSEETGSIGTNPGALPTGDWHLFITTFDLIEGSNDKMEYEIAIEQDADINEDDFLMLGKDRWTDYEKDQDALSLFYDYDKKNSLDSKWYRGDFHVHTKLSDGFFTPEEAAGFCEVNNLDFVFITEHNMITTGFEKSKTLFLPGLEVTTKRGHLNIHGIKKFINFFDFSNFEEVFMNTMLSEGKKQGANLSINHPMMKPWHWNYYETNLDSIDTIEICCDPTWKTAEEDNKLAMKALDLLWDDGHKIYGIGGSDSHLSPNEKYENATMPSIYGDPSTYVYCVGLCGSEILRGLNRGRIYVSRDVALDFIIRGEKNLYFPGDRVNLENISYKVKISNLKEAVKVYLIENGQIKDSVKVDRDTEVEFKLDWNKEGYDWARIDMRNMEDNFVSYINPIYKGEKEPSIKTWLDLLIAMEDSSTTF